MLNSNLDKMKHAFQNKDNPIVQYEMQKQSLNERELLKKEIVDEILQNIDVILEDRALKKLVEIINNIGK